MVQQITTSGTTSDKEWKWKRESVLGMILAFIMKQKVNLIPEDFYLFWYYWLSPLTLGKATNLRKGECESKGTFLTLHFHVVFCHVARRFSKNYWKLALLKGTLTPIWKSPCMFLFIWKYYSENFAFLILRILELFTRKVCEMFIYKHARTIEYIKKWANF